MAVLMFSRILYCSKKCTARWVNLRSVTVSTRRQTRKRRVWLHLRCFKHAGCTQTSEECYLEGPCLGAGVRGRPGSWRCSASGPGCCRHEGSPKATWGVEEESQTWAHPTSESCRSYYFINCVHVVAMRRSTSKWTRIGKSSNDLSFNHPFGH